jgi:hypothetical protein
MTRSRPQEKVLTTPELVVRASPGALPSITITTDAVDSMDDRILQAGLTFRTPMPVLFAHDYQQLPVGQSTREMIARLPHRTEASWRWLENDQRAAEVRNAFEQGFLGASVGMRVREASPNDVGGYNITSAECVEFSLTAVPANADCVRLLKALGWQGQPKKLACPAALDCPNITNSEQCPAGRLCPLSGHARASWRSAEPVIELIDDRDDDVLILDVGGYPRTLTKAKLEQLVDARLAKAADAAVKTAMAQARLRRGRRA